MGKQGAKTGDLGLRRGHLMGFTNAFLGYLTAGVPVTMKYALDNGFSHELVDEISGSELELKFLESVASVGFVGGKLKRTSFAGVTIFVLAIGAYSIPDFLQYLIDANGVSTAEELRSLLNDMYGIDVTYAVLREQMRRMEER